MTSDKRQATKNKELQAPARADRTASRKRRALDVITSSLPSRRAFKSTSSPPTATAAAPALMNSGVVSRFTPPVGIKSIWGKGPLSALMYLGPPTGPAGKILTMSAPACQAVSTSVGVKLFLGLGHANDVHLSHFTDQSDCFLP